MVRVGMQGPTSPPAAINTAVARFAERSGFDSYWGLDHFMGLIPPGLWTKEISAAARFVRDPEPYFDPFVLMGSLAKRTRTMSLGLAVTDTVRLHPASLARAALTLHHLTRGRFILGVGAGERENLEPYGLPADRLASRCEEALTVVRLLWGARDPVDFDGEFFHVRRATLSLPLFRKSTPPIWLAAMGPRMLEICGRLADGWLPQHVPVERWSASLAQIWRSASAAGRDPAAIVPGLFLTSLVDSTHEAAHRALSSPLMKIGALALDAAQWREAGGSHPFGETWRGIVEYVPTFVDAGEARAAVEKVPWDVLHSAFLHGTPDEIVAHIRPYAEAGLRHIVFQNVTALARPSRALPSSVAFARAARAVRRL